MAGFGLPAATSSARTRFFADPLVRLGTVGGQYPAEEEVCGVGDPLGGGPLPAGGAELAAVLRRFATHVAFGHGRTTGGALSHVSCWHRPSNPSPEYPLAFQHGQHVIV